MSTITDYRVIQADGNRALGEAVREMISKGWEPFGSTIAWPETELQSGAPAIHSIVMLQPMVKHTSDSVELQRLREMEAWISGIVEQLEDRKSVV